MNETQADWFCRPVKISSQFIEESRNIENEQKIHQHTFHHSSLEWYF